MFRYQSLLAHKCMKPSENSGDPAGAGAPSLESMTYSMTEGILQPACYSMNETSRSAGEHKTCSWEAVLLKVISIGRIEFPLQRNLPGCDAM